ncbi:MAG TPA: DAK2 domain-containing protein [Acidimicrobiales bacterium]|nr:DAK2 domain-containing protein [Acidimicrobiales bacterium]
MTTPLTLSARELRSTIATYLDLLRSHKEVINRLNVYPVPDGDTGTNMTLTIESVTAELGPLADDAEMAEVCKAIAHGSLMGARGNSGVILSQMLRGLVAKFPIKGDVSPDLLAESLENADVLARQAVVRIVEGTMLSIARAAAEGARAHGETLIELVRSARDRAKDALALTPEQLPVLKQAGVVDSGGTGLLLLYDALCSVVADDPLPIAPSADSISVHVHEETDERESNIADLRYEVMYFLDAEEDKIDGFREVWSGIGDSIVIVGGDGLYNCHIHTDNIGAAIEAALDAGRPRDIRVTDLSEQVLEERWVREGSAEQLEVEVHPAPTTAVVAVVVGEGVGRIFRSLGVRGVVSGGQSMNPSTADLVAAVRATGSDQVVLLPNNKNIRPVAEQVNDLVEQTVTVVPTNSIVEGFAALLDYDPDATAEANAKAMSVAACNVVAAEVTRAVRDTTTDVGEVRVGDWIGLTADGVRSVDGSIAGASNRLLDEIITPEHELVTIIEGEGSSPANTRRITEFLADEHPRITVEVHHGGQPLYPYYFGIE